MEKGEEENGGENNPNNINGDGDSGGNGSDETGVTDPAVHAGENGTAVVSNGKTDDNQNKKDTSQESQEQSDNIPAPDAAEHDTLTSEVPVKTDTSKSKQEPGPGSSSILSLCDNTSASDTSEHNQNLDAVTEHDNGASQFEGDEGPEEAAVTQLLATLYYTTSPEGQGTDPGMPIETSRAMSSGNGITILPTPDSPGQAFKLKADGKVPKPNDKAQDSTDLSDEKKNTNMTNASECEEMTGDGSSPGVPGTTQGAQSGMLQSAEPSIEWKNASLKEEAKAGEELKTENQVNNHDNEASQREEGEQVCGADANTSDTTEGTSEKKVGLNTDASRSEGTGSSSGDNPALASENKESGSGNLQIESGSSRAGHAGGEGVAETEAQKIDVNGRPAEEMRTGSGANKDDDKEGQPKKKKAKGEGVAGEGGITHAVKTEQHVIKQRSVSISLCTSAYSFNVEGLVSYLKGLMKKHPELIKEVKIHELPYNDLDHYRIDEKDPVDVMILCHSINNRRFAITDVMDALYDEYLPYCARVIGKEKMGVIVHDFDDMRETVQSSRMSSFKYKQPKAFETTSLQITCGHIEKEEQVFKQMLKGDRDEIVWFLEHASKYPEEMQKEESKWSLKRFFPDFKMPSFGFGSSGRANEGQIEELRSIGSNIPTDEREQKNQDSSNEGTPVDPRPASSAEGNTEPDPPRGTSPVTPQSSGAVHATAAPGTQGAIDLPSQQKITRNSFTSAPQSSSRTPRRISVSVCSASQLNVEGMLTWFSKLQAEQPHMITNVRFRELPYSNIDYFRFPTNDPVDVMVLCHSIENRGFSITNVMSALYDKYLKYCHDVIGKKKLAVIVHDFADWKPATVEGRMESFRRMQPSTFELVETVIICGRLKDSDKLGIRAEDETRLICFLELARFEPKENFQQSVSEKLF